jgi:hypothetical protein
MARLEAAGRIREDKKEEHLMMQSQPQPQATPSEQPRQLDSAEQALVMQRLRSEQNLALGIAAGAVAAAVGAAVWAVVTVVTNYQIGWMAVGVGFVVGLAVRTFGKGLDQVFGIVGAGLALLGCLAGNLLAVCGMIAQQESLGFFAVFSSLDMQVIQELMVATFSPMDLLFYGIAVYEGYKFSFRDLSAAEMEKRVS